MFIKTLSLFSGIGAFEKGLERLGIKCQLMGYSEIEASVSKMYSEIHNIPESLNLGDVRKIKESKLEEFEIMFWGFPCTNFSKATRDKETNRKGLKNEASGLYYDGLRILKKKKPFISVIENVPDLAGKDFAEQFSEILSDLDESGYKSYYSTMKANEYNVVQSRERLFIVSIRKDIDKGFTFPEALPLTKKATDILEEASDIDDKFLSINPKIIEKVKTRKLRNPSICPTITKAVGRAGSSSEYISNCAFVYQNTGIVRRMTPKETMLFMDFEEKDYESAKRVASDTGIFNVSGNSICVGVAEALLKRVLIDYNYIGDIAKKRTNTFVIKRKKRTVLENQISFFV